MKKEIDYVVERNCSNGMIVKNKYFDRLQMLKENPSIDRTKWIAVETETEFIRYNEINGSEMKWI